MNTDPDARQVYANAGAVNHRRRIIVRRAVDHWWRAIVAAVPAGMSMIATVVPNTIASVLFRASRAAGPTTVLASVLFRASSAVVPTTVLASMLFRASRCDKRPEHENGGEGEPCRRLCRQVSFRFGVDDAGHGDLL